MEFANHEMVAEQVRIASLGDTAVLTQLLQNAVHQHYHADWHLPVDWLGRPAFVIWEEALKTPSSFVEKLIGKREQVRACLAAAADPLPAAWVRVAALMEAEKPLTILAPLLQKVEALLRETAVTELGWMPTSDWPERWLTALGFQIVNQMQTYVKMDMSLPTLPALPHIVIRPLVTDDVNRLAEIERTAFDPLWRQSARGLLKAQTYTFSFDVALWQEKIVGFQMSTQDGHQAHLAHIAVDVDCQAQGIGTALLAHALEGYKVHGLQAVSLNTQIDNWRSQQFYGKFGFVAQEERFSVWAKSL